MKHLYSLLFLVCSIITLKGQDVLHQYFDGADTFPYETIYIELDTSSSNIWQIGEPEKMLFDTASSFPNVIMTELDEYYAAETTSSFIIDVPVFWAWGILALTWSQKIDFENGHDGGFVEFWNPEDSTWNNVFTSPYVYNYYGWNSENVDTLLNGNVAFTGLDTSWRDIWLCFEMSYFYYDYEDTIHFRFTFQSDTSNLNHEGWMIDDMNAFITYAHTIKNEEDVDEMIIFPNLTTGIVNIETEKIMGPHYIETIDVFDVNGRLVQSYGISPTRFSIDIGDNPGGMYFLRIKTNLRERSFPVMLVKNS